MHETRWVHRSGDKTAESPRRFSPKTRRAAKGFRDPIRLRLFLGCSNSSKKPSIFQKGRKMDSQSMKKNTRAIFERVGRKNG